MNTLYKGVVLQFEIAVKQESKSEFLQLFIEAGYHQYSSMVRMSKIKDNIVHANNLNFLPPDRLHDIKWLFDTFFDKFVEQIPSIEELSTLISDKNIVFMSEDNITIQGFLISEIKGFTSHLRYWFVHPDHRNKKIGSVLIKHFLA